MSTVNVFCPMAMGAPADHAKHLGALAKGIPGARLLPLEDGYVDCDIAVVFGMGKRLVPTSYPRGAVVYEHHYRRRKPILIVERGFVDRENYYGVALNGLNGLGDFVNSNSPPDRWDLLNKEIKPWFSKDPEGYILLCGQVPWDASVQHVDHVQWCQDTYFAIRARTSRGVIFRPHPLAKDEDYGLPKSERSWEHDLAGAHCLVTFNSTSGALAALEGIPVFAMDEGSIAYDISNHTLDIDTIENPECISREQWAYDLAYTQWTAEEMQAGLTWAHIKKGL